MSSTLSPLVVTIVLNWNNPEDTIRCLKSLTCLTYLKHRVLVVDNGSSDNSAQVLAEFTQKHPGLTLLLTGENLGFSGGVNYGINAAHQLNADYIWLLNNDTEVAPNALTALVQAIQDRSDVAIAGSKIFLYNDPETLWHAGAELVQHIGRPQHLGMGATATDPRYTVNRLVEYVTGCSFLIRAAVLEQIGQMDDRFYLYYEEVDLCYRSRQQGWQVLYVADSQVWHKVAGSSAGLPERTYYEVRNRLLLMRKHQPQTLPFVLAYLVLQEMVKPLLKGKITVAKFAVLGLRDFLKGKFGRLK